MSSAVLKGNASGTGVVTLQSPNTNTDRTITLPDSDSTLNIVGPAFACSLTNNGDQTLASPGPTILPFNVQIFNRGSGTFNTSNYTYTVPLTGYYWVYAQCYGTNSGGNATMKTLIYKNGSWVSEIPSLGDVYVGNASATVAITPLWVQGIVRCNAGDTISIYGAAYNGSAIYRAYTGQSLFSVHFLG